MIKKSRYDTVHNLGFIKQIDTEDIGPPVQSEIVLINNPAFQCAYYCGTEYDLLALNYSYRYLYGWSVVMSQVTQSAERWDW